MQGRTTGDVLCMFHLEIDQFMHGFHIEIDESIKGMHHRAAYIGADLHIRGDKDGVTMILLVPVK